MKNWRQWPSCNHPKTHSIRFNSDDVYKTVNSVFFEDNNINNNNNNNDQTTPPESWFTNSASDQSTDSDSDDLLTITSLETLVAGARSQRRLFFDPCADSNSILAAKSRFSAAEPCCSRNSVAGALRESVAVAVDSGDPYGDFRRSMAEMVEANGVNDWEGLEELLGWYLKVNEKDSHGFVVGAFVDLLLDLSAGAGDSFPAESFVTAAESEFSSEIVSFSEEISTDHDHR